MKHMSFTKSYSKLTLLFAGFAVATFIATLFNAPTAHAANPKWLNRQDMVMDGAVFRDPNTLDNDLTYHEVTTRVCKSFIYISPNGSSHIPFDKDGADKIFYLDEEYNDILVGRHLVTQREIQNPLNPSQNVCQQNAPQPITIDSPENRRIVFIEENGSIINLITGAKFTRVATDFAGIPRYVSEVDIANNDQCADLIVMKAGSSDDYESEFGSAQQTSKVLYVVGPNGAESSPSYKNASGLPSNCNVEGSRLGTYGLVNPADDGDDVLRSAGFNASGNIERSTYDFDAYLIFVGNSSNKAIDPTTGGGLPPPAAPPTSTLQPVCEDDSTVLAYVLCGGISLVQDTFRALFENIIRPFLGVTPVGSVQGLEQLWRNILAIANIAYIVVFFIIIFSQATSIGITNYGIKRMLPRLIIVAILSNLSLYICAFAVDLANILGLGVASLILLPLNGMGGDSIRITGDFGTWITTLGGITWAGSALAASGGLLAGVFALVVILGIALLAVVLLLLARQILIFTYIAFSPIIFVGFILPGTARLSSRLTIGFLNLLWAGPIIMACVSLSGLIIIIIENLP